MGIFLAIVLLFVGLVAGVSWGGRFAVGRLALYWIWSGVFYHIGHFVTLNRAAVVFGGLFVIQGVLLAGAAIRNKPVLGTPRGARGIAGAVLIAYTLFIYPLISLA